MAAENKYANGKIYMLESASAGLVYYGSTYADIRKRMCQHRIGSKRFKNGKTNWLTSFEVVDKPDCRVLLVEAFPCSSKQELIAREAWHIRNNPCINKHIPDRTKHEYHRLHYQQTKDATLAQCKRYYAENRQTISEKAKKPTLCPECNISMNKSSLSGHKKSKKHTDNVARLSRAVESEAISPLLSE